MSPTLSSTVSLPDLPCTWSSGVWGSKESSPWTMHRKKRRPWRRGLRGRWVILENLPPPTEAPEETKQRKGGRPVREEPGRIIRSDPHREGLRRCKGTSGLSVTAGKSSSLPCPPPKCPRFPKKFYEDRSVLVSTEYSLPHPQRCQTTVSRPGLTLPPDPRPDVSRAVTPEVRPATVALLGGPEPSVNTLLQPLPPALGTTPHRSPTEQDSHSSRKRTTTGLGRILGPRSKLQLLVLGLGVGAMCVYLLLSILHRPGPETEGRGKKVIPCPDSDPLYTERIFRLRKGCQDRVDPETPSRASLTSTGVRVTSHPLPPTHESPTTHSLHA